MIIYAFYIYIAMYTTKISWPSTQGSGHFSGHPHLPKRRVPGTDQSGAHGGRCQLSAGALCSPGARSAASAASVSPRWGSTMWDQED